MKTYLVGGAVRDNLLRQGGRNTPLGDNDWVVVGSSPEEMTKKGFLPVGKDFPVFLHPKTHEEYALARTERKTSHGYHGFSFYTSSSVTIEEDLARRDLTINAIAQDDEGNLIDPFGGAKDIKSKTLRHVSSAFLEDPVRLLRLARFAARLPDFSVAPETQALVKEMVASGETDHLVAERVFAEISRGLMEVAPTRMLDILEGSGYWPRAFSEAPITEALRAALRAAAATCASLPVRASILFSNVREAVLSDFCERHKFPSDVSDAVTLFIRNREAVLQAKSAKDYFDALQAFDLIRRPHRLEVFLQTLTLFYPSFNVARFRKLALSFSQVDVAPLIKEASGIAIKERIDAARFSAIEKALNP